MATILTGKTQVQVDDKKRLDAIASIKGQLLILDAVIPRSVEDLYSAQKVSAYPSVQSVIDEKVKLRLQLENLEK